MTGLGAKASKLMVHQPQRAELVSGWVMLLEVARMIAVSIVGQLAFPEPKQNYKFFFPIVISADNYTVNIIASRARWDIMLFDYVLSIRNLLQWVLDLGHDGCSKDSEDCLWDLKISFESLLEICCSCCCCCSTEKVL